jgi:DNA-binding GntR family transcriptional regulator
VDFAYGVSKMSAKTTMLAPPPVANGMSYNGNHSDDSVSSLPPIEVSNRRSQAWRVLRESIVSGRLPAGTKLIGSQLAEQLGVSRTPLREAIQLLEREGFVRRLPSGVVEVVGLSADEIEEVYAIRARMEGLATRYAALRATPEELAQLAGIMADMRDAVRRGHQAEVDAGGAAFHGVIHRASHLTFAIQQLATMRDHIDRYRAQTIVLPGRQDAVIEEHAEVVRWLEEREGDRAEDAMRRHIWNAWLTISGASGSGYDTENGGK